MNVKLRNHLINLVTLKASQRQHFSERASRLSKLFLVPTAMWPGEWWWRKTRLKFWHLSNVINKFCLTSPSSIRTTLKSNRGKGGERHSINRIRRIQIPDLQILFPWKLSLVFRSSFNEYGIGSVIFYKTWMWRFGWMISLLLGSALKGILLLFWTNLSCKIFKWSYKYCWRENCE